MTMRRIVTVLTGLVAAGFILAAGQAPATAEPTTRHVSPVHADGKDWTAPWGPGH